MIKNFIERIFWIQDQLKLRYWQEPRLYHSIQLSAFYYEILTKFDNLVKAYMSADKTVEVSEQLYVLENDMDMDKILFEIREFMDFLKTHPQGWGGGMQSIIDDILATVEIFANTFNKQ